MMPALARQQQAARRARLAVARQGPPQVLDADPAREFAAFLIARRIVLGISDKKLVEELGSHDFLKKHKNAKGKRAQMAVYEEARRIERNLIEDGRLSSFQDTPA